MVMLQIEQRHAALRLDPISGLGNREQFSVDLHDLARDATDEPRTLVLIDALDMNWAHELTLAVGMRPFESLIRCIAERLQEQPGGR
jgi:GGDEF domain-containing protein